MYEYILCHRISFNLNTFLGQKPIISVTKIRLSVVRGWVYDRAVHV